MAKATTKEMIALIDADIKCALEIGDKEFVALMKDAKAKLLDEVHPTRHEEYAELFGMYAEYAELFGEQAYFFLDKPFGICDNIDNEERLLERDTPVRSCDTASLSEDF